MLIFLTGIMPALARLSDDQFVPAMRRINETVPRGRFLLVFLAIWSFPAAALAVPVDGRTDTQLWLIVAGLVCAVLNHLVTIAGNIPLNNALASSESASPAVPTARCAPPSSPAGTPSTGSGPCSRSHRLCCWSLPRCSLVRRHPALTCFCCSEYLS